jgi:hypothetical protein
MATVTYKGPTQKGDGTTRYVIGGVRFPVDRPVETDDKAILDRINAGITGHKFEVEKASATAAPSKDKS